MWLFYFIKNMKKVFKIVLGLVLAFLIITLMIAMYRLWAVRTGRMVRLDGGLYLSTENFHKLYPPQNVVLPDKNKPEEVYTAFRNAVIAGNIDEALKYITERKRAVYKVNLVKNLESYKKLPEFGELRELDNYSGVQAGYSYFSGERKLTVLFDKTWDGYWFIYGI